MERARHKQSKHEASQPVYGRRQIEGLPAAALRLYVRPKLRREGDVRDVTLGSSSGPSESGQTGTFSLGGIDPRSSEGEGFLGEPEAQGQKKESSGGEGAGFRNP